jgi:hypothetical protein
MKKIIFAAMLTIASIAAFARTDKAGRKMLKEYESALKGQSNLQWTNKETFSEARFSLNGHEIKVFQNTDGGLVGFSKSIDLSELPENSLATIEQKYNGVIADQIMFIDNSGNTSYYVGERTAKGYIVLKISPAGKVSFYTKK